MMRAERDSVPGTRRHETGPQSALEIATSDVNHLSLGALWRGVDERRRPAVGRRGRVVVVGVVGRRRLDDFVVRLVLTGTGTRRIRLALSFVQRAAFYNPHFNVINYVANSTSSR